MRKMRIGALLVAMILVLAACSPGVEQVEANPQGTTTQEVSQAEESAPVDTSSESMSKESEPMAEETQPAMEAKEESTSEEPAVMEEKKEETSGAEMTVEETEDVSSQVLEVGKKIPNYALTTADGEVVELRSLEGKMVAIVFWTTW